MVTNRSYEEVVSIFPADRMTQGFTHDALQEALWRFGFASIFLYRVDQLALTDGRRRPDRDPWPPVGLPFPRIIQACGHYVVEVEACVVLDPAIDGRWQRNEWPKAVSVVVPVRFMGL